MVARRMFSMRVRIGESGVSTALVSATSFLMSYERSGVFQPEPVPQAISFPLSTSNGWQMSGGPASAGVAKKTMAAMVTNERIKVVMAVSLLGHETERTVPVLGFNLLN